MMHWKTKAILQRAFDLIPGGEALNSFSQRRVLHSLPVGESTFQATVDSARRHLVGLRRHGEVPVNQARFFEFGAGKDLIVPLAFYCLGVNDQTLADIRRLAREDLVVDALRRLSGVKTEIERPPEPALAVEGLDQRLAALGITYRAPCDARSTGLGEASVDYVTSTSTLEHIPEPDIRLILQECRRILRPDGRLSLLIDYQDHYSYADSSISAYNFLRYDDRQWARWNPPLQYQNRLRHSDYLALFEEQGFAVVDDDPWTGSSDDLQVIRELPLAEPFRNRSGDDLAIRNSLVTLERATAR